MSDRESRIGEIAYHLWVREGCPEGRSHSHWLEAVALYEAEVAESKSAKAEPPTEPSAEPIAETQTRPSKPQPAEPVAAKPAPAAKPKADKPAAETPDAKRKAGESEPAAKPAAKPPAKAPSGAGKRK